jgi:hypothetical protein
MINYKWINLIRYSLVPVVVIIIFINFALNNQGTQVYVVGFFLMIVIVASIAINRKFSKSVANNPFLPPEVNIVDGIEGKAKLLTVRYLNMMVNRYPQYELKFLVTIPDKEPYETTMRQHGTPLIIARLKEGAEFDVIADKDNPHIIEVPELKNYYKL